MTKDHLSFEEQVALLTKRGLTVADSDACTSFLTRANYYRFSGYARYFQEAPREGRNNFEAGTSFDDIRQIYELDHQLRALCLDGLALAETTLRTQFAHTYSAMKGPYGSYLQDAAFICGNNDKPVTEAIYRDLERSKEPYVHHFRKTDPQHPDAPPDFSDMPIWAAVEAMSFGTLSRCIERCADQDVPKQVAASLGVAWDGFQSQVKAFVYLRNRSAHHSRLWNHSVLDAPRLPNNLKSRAKRHHGQFDPRSVFTILVALDNMLTKAGASTTFLSDATPLIDANPVFREGITKPHPPGRSAASS